MAISLSDIINTYKNVLVQIATPYSTGTGFYLAGHKIIVTNEHVIRGNRRVVINGNQFSRCLSDVLYVDPKLDIAFLAPPGGVQFPVVKLNTERILVEGDQIVAIGHPFGLKFTATNGIVSNASHRLNDMIYIQHDAALNPGNSGGPLVSMDAGVAGVNTFIIRDGNNIGFSLPSRHLAEAIFDFEKGGSQYAARCHSCSNLVFEDSQEGEYCTHCGAKVTLPNRVEAYEPVGINKTIEIMLQNLGHDVELSRIGANHWEIKEGSAKISLSYHEETGLIIGDAFLAQLPKKNIKPIYELLLRENYNLENLSFCVRGKDIILSLIVYDRYLNEETGGQLMKHLFERADHFDNILVEEYGALWKNDQDI
ncbi:MAG: trypsin-like peptidase domain-containing protein [Saprospiraceae bacterium]|nr:trypsin-like peptidase domain-containing protein [Saprospiraceae bacterium]